MADGTPGSGGSLKTGVPAGSARSRSDGMGTVGTGEDAGAGTVTKARGARVRATRGGVLAHQADGRGPPPDPTQCQWQRLFVGASEWRCSLKAARQSEAPGRQAAKVRTRPDQLSRRNRLPVKCFKEGACWATAVAAAGTSAEPVPPSDGTAKTEAKAMSTAGKMIRSRDGNRS